LTDGINNQARTLNLANRNLTCRTLIELLEYVRLNATLPLAGDDGKPDGTFKPMPTGAVIGGEGRGILPPLPPRDDPDDTVSKESCPCSIELEMSGGRGGTESAGANSPFRVVADPREPIENSPLALGADATRRMNREAEALTDLGLKAPFVREREEGVIGGLGNDVWVGSAVSGWIRGGGCGRAAVVAAFDRPRSDFVYCRVRPAVASASVDFGCFNWGYEVFCGVGYEPLMPWPTLESLDWVLEEL